MKGTPPNHLSEYDANLSRWRSQSDAGIKLRLAQGLLLKHTDRVDETFEEFLDSPWARTVSLDDAIDMIDSTIQWGSKQEITGKERALLEQWMDKINPTVEILAAAPTTSIPVKMSKEDVLDICTSWAEKKWGGTEKMRQYAIEVAQTSIRFAAKDPKGMDHLWRVLQYSSPDQKVSSWNNKKSWVEAWTAVVLVEQADVLECAGETLRALIHFGADVEGLEPERGGPLALACRAYEEGYKQTSEAAINLLLDHGAEWRNLRTDTIPQALGVIKNHPAVRREGLNEISQSIQGQGGVESSNQPSRSQLKM